MGASLAVNWIGLAALIISIVLAVVRLAEWWTNRRRKYVTCQSQSVGIPAGDGKSVSTRSYVTVTVTTEGAPIAIARLGFELVGESSESTQEPGMGSVNDIPTLSRAGLPPTGFGDPVNLASGTSEAWAVSLSVPPFDYSTMVGYMFRADVELTNGKHMYSKPFWHVPSPPMGWSGDDVNARLSGA
ncbi:Hypothetical protein PFCIRM119_04820 [Propionibacterium freudenreichii]|nr:Hypothetical protein PFCIRM129_05840 [Propionibacterium freudenreichii subsp. freudenreichii]CEG87908.1 Hypothetical protein PFCIRM119_04820 [Propionibacterium freudenreichii]SCQ77533.1 Hypothetical protein PFR_JS17-2_657 [Propionibacterium freudenreichii]